MKKKMIVNKGIRDVIAERLSIQTTQRQLMLFGIKVPCLRLFESASFKSCYANWDQEKQNNFIKVLGGPINFKKTKEYIEGKGQ